MSYDSEVLADSPLWYPKLDEASGATTMVDSSGNSHSGTYNNSPTLGVAGLVLDGGTSVTWNGTNQFATVAGAGWMNTTDYAIEFWPKTTTNNVYVIDRANVTKVWDVFVRVAGTIAFVTYTPGGTAQQLNGSVAINDGNRHHVVCVKSGTTMSIYIDGVLDTSTTSFTTFATSGTQQFDIARRGTNASYFAGTLDNMAYYGAALTGTRVAAHFAAGGALAIGRATVTNTARALAVGGALAIGRATVTNTARALTLSRAISIGRGSVTNTARALTVGTGGTAVPIGRAGETDIARAFRLAVTHLSWDGGLGIAFSSSGGEFDPAYVAPPVPLATRVIVAQAIDSVAQDGVQFTPSVRVAEDGYAPYRIVVGGTDVTYFRGVQTPMPTYGLVSPLRYGSGQITFPQVHAAYERPGHGTLAWLRKFAPVKIQRVDSGGTVLATDYVGFISDYQHQGRTLTCTLGGEATGLAAMVDRQAQPFSEVHDIGSLVQQTIRTSLRLATVNTPTTGIKLQDTGGMPVLDFLTETLAKSTTKDGKQWTVRPTATGRYKMEQKDTTTIRASVYIDGFRVVEDLHRDFTEEPNRVYAQGVGPDGLRNRFAIYPGLAQAGDLAFPGTLSPGDAGTAVTQMLWRLFTMGYLDDSPNIETWTTAGDDPITGAIKDLQADAGLSQTGVVNAATWRALFNPDITGYSLKRSQIIPAAQRSFTKFYLSDATGNIIGRNPAYLRNKPYVDVSVDMGTGFTRHQMAQWARQELADDNAANWVGTVTVNMGAVINGTHNPGDPLDSSDVLDARAIHPGDNLWLPNWDDGTLVHVSGVNVSATSVEFTVDTRARDTMKVWQVITRNRESRKSPARQWIAQNRRSHIRDDTGAFYDGATFGKIPRTFCAANTWTVVPTPAGRSGILQTVDIQTTDTEAKFGLWVSGKQFDDLSTWLDAHVGDPFDIDGVTFGVPYSEHVQRNTKTWTDAKGLIDIWGDENQPCGYWPRQHTNSAGTVTDAPITGQFRFTAGTPYLCQRAPVLWIAVRPDRNCWVEGGRVLELLLDDAAG